MFTQKQQAGLYQVFTLFFDAQQLGIWKWHFGLISRKLLQSNILIEVIFYILTSFDRMVLMFVFFNAFL